MKILILYASLGAGHRRAALALQEAFQERNVTVEVRDILDFLPAPLKWFYPWFYEFMIEDARWIWRMVYSFSNLPKAPYSPATSISQKWQFNELNRFLKENRFTHILGTHFTPCALLTDWKMMDGLEARIYSVITDYTAHRCWLRKDLTQYFVATNHVAEELVEAGIAKASICVSGIPISPAFSHRQPKRDARRLVEILPGEKTLLVLTSGLNVRSVKVLLRDLRRIDGQFRYLISAGKDGDRTARIQELCKNDSRFTVFGFSSRIPEMMNAADLLVSKPGGLIVSEALAMAVPQLLFSPIPGQEEANANYLVKENAAVQIEMKSGEFKRVIQYLFNENGRLSAMSEAARNIGHPQAAHRIVEQVLADRNIS